MQYQRSLDIERRLEAVLRLVREKRHTTPGMAKPLHVSVPTVSRDLTALRERGFDIRAERTKEGWHYKLDSTEPRSHAEDGSQSGHTAPRRLRGRRR
ncbi:MAG: HTH domain-containing protein [Phycisphaerales bacterium]|jgi:predicted DNA-binding transcriptional regulator YafY